MYHGHRDDALLPYTPTRPRRSRGQQRTFSRRSILLISAFALLCVVYIVVRPGSPEPSSELFVDYVPDPAPLEHYVGEEDIKSVKSSIDEHKANTVEPLPAPSYVHTPVSTPIASRPIHPFDFTLPDLSLLPKHAIITYIPYTFSYPMLLQTLEAYHHAAWEHIIILDNSWHRDAFNAEPELQEKYRVLKVVLTTSHLQFSAVMATIDTLAASSGHDRYLWTHSDIMLLSDHPRPYDLVVECIDKASTADPQLGVLFFDYDLLSMVNVRVAQKNAWDPMTLQYGSDCDRYTRIRLAGFTTPESREVCSAQASSMGKLINMNAILSPPELSTVLSNTLDFSNRLHIIEVANKEAKFHAWRKEGGASAMGKIDREMFGIHEREGGVYFMNKWAGKKAGFGRPCNLRPGDKPYFDVPAVPIVPRNLSEA